MNNVIGAYVGRNHAWLRPLTMTATLAITLEVYSTDLANSGPAIPAWISTCVLAIGGLRTGFGTMLADTTSARMLQLLSLVAGVVLLLR